MSLSLIELSYIQNRSILNEQVTIDIQNKILEQFETRFKEHTPIPQANRNSYFYHVFEIPEVIWLPYLRSIFHFTFRDIDDNTFLGQIYEYLNMINVANLPMKFFSLIIRLYQSSFITFNIEYYKRYSLGDGTTSIIIYQDIDNQKFDMFYCRSTIVNYYDYDGPSAEEITNSHFERYLSINECFEFILDGIRNAYIPTFGSETIFDPMSDNYISISFQPEYQDPVDAIPNNLKFWALQNN